MQAQRDPDAHIVWLLARCEAETSEQYLARVSSEVAKTAGLSLAYRPGGRANILYTGVRSNSRLSSDSSLEGSIVLRKDGSMMKFLRGSPTIALTRLPSSNARALTPGTSGLGL